jgi:hypothetical protein
MSNSIIYRGARDENGTCHVYWSRQDETREFPLDPRHDIRNHSPDGFEWGYGGSGPAQLALAILAHHLENMDRPKDLTPKLYQDFKFRVIGAIPQKANWSITTTAIESWLEGERHRPFSMSGAVKGQDETDPATA